MATFEWGEFVFTLIQSPIADPQPRSPAMLFHGASFTLFHRNIDILTFNAQEALSAVPDSTSLKVHSHASWTMARPHYTPIRLDILLFIFRYDTTHHRNNNHKD